VAADLFIHIVLTPNLPCQGLIMWSYYYYSLLRHKAAHDKS